MMVNGKIIKLVDTENTSGQMEEHMKENGLIIICMGKVCILGKMAGSMKANTIMIKNM